MSYIDPNNPYYYFMQPSNKPKVKSDVEKVLKLLEKIKHNTETLEFSSGYLECR